MKRFAYKNKKQKNYFEGWYFRFVGDVNIGVIFALTKYQDDPHAFIQIFNHDSSECEYLRYNIEDFYYDAENDVVHINDYSLSNYQVSVKGISLKIKNHQVFSDKSAMTYLEHAPLECFQEVLYMKADASGSVYGKDVIGIAYSEKTYGTNFPSKWVWLQSFHSKNGSLMSFSVGMVPVLFFRIKGFFILLDTVVGKFRLSSTNFAKIRVGESIVMKKRKIKIVLEPVLNHKVKLVGPSKNGLMNLDVYESLDSEVHLKIYRGKELLLEDLFKDVGMELMFHGQR